MPTDTLTAPPVTDDQLNAMLPPQPKPTALFDKAVLLQLDITRLGNSRSTDTGIVNADTDKDLLHVSKTLLDSVELKAVQTIDNQIRVYIQSKCLPSVLRKGVFILPIASITKVNSRLMAFSNERTKAVDAFVDVYPNLVTMAQARLRSLFNPNEYPGCYMTDNGVQFTNGYGTQVKAKFNISWNYISFGVPDVLAEIDQELFDEEKAKASAQWQEAQSTIQELLRVRMAALVHNLTDRLTPGEDGKAKVFKSATINNIDEFLQDFEALNLTDDTQLSEVVNKAKLLLQGVDAETLRKSKDLQADIKAGFETLENQLSTMVTTKPKRGIKFTDD